jgi:SAM-dependent methyltransferase
MKVQNEIHNCEVCGNDKVVRALDLGSHPLCDDLIAVADGRICNEFSIDIVFCPQCVTAHQRFQVPKRVLFPETYHYRSRFTADVLSGMSSLVDACADRLVNLKDKLVLDIGCNDGSLLDFFHSKGALTIGIEPTGAYLDAQGKGHEIFNSYFDLEAAQAIRNKYGTLDVITFTNVFAHIEDLASVINALKVLMTPTTLLVIENHYLGAVLDRIQFDTFYHEHPRTYSLSSFQYIAQSLGLALVDVQFPSRYGGNIRVFIGGKIDADSNNRLSTVNNVLEKEKRYGERLKEMQGKVDKWKSRMSSQISSLVARHGRLSAKAFPGRAAILIKLLGLDVNSIEAVYEKPGSMKIGHYVPGTRIPIKSDNEFFCLTEKPKVVLNLAWHISSEIRDYLRKNGYQGEIVDILNPLEYSE